MKISVLGNSHVRYFAGQATVGDDPKECAFGACGMLTAVQLGGTGATIWGLPNSGSATGAGQKIPQYITQQDPHVVVLVLGEVDVREHILPRANASGSILPQVVPVVERYADYLGALQPERHANWWSRRVVLAGCVPYSKSRVVCDPRINDAAIVFNYCLSSMASALGYRYLDLYTSFVDPFGALRDEYARDPTNPSEVHLHYEKSHPLVLDLLHEALR